MFSRSLNDIVMDIAKSYLQDSNSEEAEYQNARKGLVMLAGVGEGALAGPPGAGLFATTTGALMDIAATRQKGEPVGLVKAMNEVAKNGGSPDDVSLCIGSDFAAGLAVTGESSIPSTAIKIVQLAIRQAEK